MHKYPFFATRKAVYAVMRLELARDGEQFFGEFYVVDASHVEEVEALLDIAENAPYGFRLGRYNIAGTNYVVGLEHGD